MEDSFYSEVYGQDNPADGANGWIQWKGTDICIDVHCACGTFYHVHGGFLYFWRCPECGTIYALGQNVKLIALNAEQVREVEDNRSLCMGIGDEGTGL